MKIASLINYSSSLLKKRNLKAFTSASSLICIFLFFRLAEAAAASIILYCTDISPAELFSADNSLWQLFVFACTLLKYAAAAPVSFAVWGWFTGFCCDEKIKIYSIAEILSDFRLAFKCISIFICKKAVLLITFLPVAVFAAFSADLFGKGDSVSLFYAVHCFSMTVLSIFLWLWTMLGMTAVPFLMLRDVKCSPFSLIFNSFKIMKGRRRGLLKMLLLYLIPMCLIVTIPFLISGLFMSLSLYINISIKEVEYNEWIEIQSGNRKTNNTAKLSAWKSGSFTPPADKA